MTVANPPAVACIANIGPKERRKRMTFGVVLFGVGLALSLAFVLAAPARPWRLLVFLPFWAGAIGVFQARDRT